MMQTTTQRQLLRLSPSYSLFPSLLPPPFPHHLYFSGRPTIQHPICSASPRAWLAQLSEEFSAAAAAQPQSDGPIDLPSTISSLISASGDTSALQTAASFLITGAFSLFLFSTLRRSAKRAKERKLRSAALESLMKASTSPLNVEGKKKKRKPPSVDETLLGAFIAAAFGILLYKFTTSVENTLNNQPLSSNYSVRQITITIRTIINGMCYLATFVFGFNSLGLFLYSGQLAKNLFVDVSVSDDKTRSNSSTLYSENVDSSEDQSSDNNPLQK